MMSKYKLHILIFYSSYLLLVGCQEEQAEYVDKTVTGAIQLNNTVVNAGETISGSVSVTATLESESFYLLLSGPKIEYVTLLDFNEVNNAQFVLPDSVLQHSTKYFVTFFSNRHGLIAQETCTVRPLAAAGKMDVFTGPNTIRLAGQEKSMLSLIPKDIYGNAVASDTDVFYSLQYPSAQSTVQVDQVSDMFSSLEFASKSEEGKIIIGTSAGDAGSNEQEVSVISNCPENIIIDVISMIPQADSRQYVQIKSQQLSDSYGNIVADGTMMEFFIKEENRFIASYQALTIDGIATVYIQNPEHATHWSVQASVCDDVRSNELIISFDNFFEDYDLSFDGQSNRIMIGPVKTISGQFLPDGTLIDLLFSSDKLTYRHQTQLVSGQAIVDLESTSMIFGKYEIVVNVLGLKKKFNLTWRD